jgi:hypothetical protein
VLTKSILPSHSFQQKDSYYGHKNTIQYEGRSAR